MNESAPIAQLEVLLNEFYHSSTSNFRRQEIDRILKNFQNSESSYKLLIENLASGFNNQYLWFFSVSTIEITITKKWNTLDINSKNMIRSYLWHVYSSFPSNVGAMQRDKISQLISLIGKNQFPEDHPDFVNQILELIKSKFLLGITLLKSTFNEISSTKPDVSYHRKKSFIQGVTLSLPDIVQLLNKFLTLCVCRVSNSELVLTPANEFISTSLPNDDRFVTCCTELLLCISNMFSWAQTSETKIFTSEFFNNIFELCKDEISNSKFVNIHIVAIMTICELFYLQKPLPQPAIMSNGITELIQQNLSQSMEEYQDKLTELLKLFLTQQWSRCVNSKDFPSKEFLLFHFNFTFQPGISALTFTERLSTWKPIIQSFNEKSAGRYTETIVQLISNVFKKMQFACDNELDLLDTEELDENMQTELGTFLSQCISIITIAAEVEPVKIFDLINNEFTRDQGKLKMFVTLIASDDISNYLSSPFEFHCLVRDLSSLLQTITQLSSVVLNSTEERSQSISIVIRSVIYTFKLVARKKLHLRNYGNQQDLIELHAQLLTSLRSLLLLRNDVCEDYDEIFSLVSAVTQILLDTDEPLIVTNSAAQLLLTITSGVRPNWILNNPSILELVQSDLRHQNDRHVRFNIKRIIFNCLLLPYNKIAINQMADQDYEKRGGLAAQYISFITGKFLAINLSAEIIEGSPESFAIFEQTKLELADCEELLTAYEETNTISKQMLLAAMQKVINKAIELFQKFGKNPSIYEEIVNFFLSVIRCLQLQLGADFVIQIIRLFLEMATLTNGNAQALNKLLQMLTFIVQQSGSVAGQLMPDILKMTLEDLLPQQIDISFNLYTLFDALLVNHFQKISQEHQLKIFTAFGQFLCNGTNSQDPNVISIILGSIEKLQDLWRLYDKVFFKNILLQSFICTLIRLLVSPGGVLFYDQIVSIVFHMAEKNKTLLQESFASVGYPVEIKIIQQICESCDLPTFSNHMQILLQDTIYTQYSQ